MLKRFHPPAHITKPRPPRKRKASPVDKRTNRKEEILDVAAQLFAEHGYDAVSQTELAKAVGLSKATLYHHFSSKEEILGAIIVTTIRELNDFINDAISGVAEPDIKFVVFLEAQGDFFERHQRWFQVLLTCSKHITDHNVRDEATKWRVKYEHMIKGIIRDGVVAGVFQTDSPNSVVRTVLSLVYWFARWYRPNGPKTAREIAREYANVVLHGISVRQKPKVRQ